MWKGLDTLIIVIFFSLIFMFFLSKNIISLTGALIQLQLHAPNLSNPLPSQSKGVQIYDLNEMLKTDMMLFPNSNHSQAKARASKFITWMQCLELARCFCLKSLCTINNLDLDLNSNFKSTCKPCPVWVKWLKVIFLNNSYLIVPGQKHS